MRFVVVTGMSGGGKRTALKLLEDAGFYCVDNLPVSLVEKFVELIAMPGSEISKVALGLDVRADQNFTDATRILEQLKEKGYKFEILFMDSDDTALIKRYKELSCSFYAYSPIFRFFSRQMRLTHATISSSVSTVTRPPAYSSFCTKIRSSSSFSSLTRRFEVSIT